MLVFVIVPARQGSVKATDGLRQADNRMRLSACAERLSILCTLSSGRRAMARDGGMGRLQFLKQLEAFRKLPRRLGHGFVINADIVASFPWKGKRA